MSTVVVHDPINVDGVEYSRGDAISGDLADQVLANQIWARSVTRIADGLIEQAAPPAAAPSAPASVPQAPTVAPAPSATTTITETAKSP